MNLLAIDTSTTRAALALALGDKIHHHLGGSPAEGGRHGRALLPEITALLAAAGLRPRDLHAIAVGLGPGTYTGLRVGVTAAKTLAFALGKPLVTIDSFTAIAANAPPEATSIHVIADAQRGDLFLTRFERPRPDAPPLARGPLTVVAMASWAAALVPGTWVLGSTLDRFRVEWPAGVHLGTTDQGQPAPEALIELGRAAVRTEQWADLATIEPAYIRRSAAEDQWDNLRTRP